MNTNTAHRIKLPERTFTLGEMSPEERDYHDAKSDVEYSEKLTVEYKSIVDNTALDERQKKKQLGPVLLKIHAHKSKLIRARDIASAEYEYAMKASNGARIFIDWIVLADELPRITRNECSRLHALMEYSKTCGVESLGRGGQVRSRFDASALLHDVHGVFLVQHNWHGAIGQAIDAERVDGKATIKLPLNRCAFEFVINNAPCVVVATQDDVDMDIVMEFFFFHGGVWFHIGHDVEEHGIRSYLRCQIEAACVALDASVAASSVVRAPEKLNKKRMRSNKVPLFDYNVIDLTRRTYAERLENGHVDGRKKVRLHFRRGHWRHYENHKTWIKWMLVGCPDVGFISHDYML